MLNLLGKQKLTTIQVFEAAGIHRKTHYKVEKGDSNIALGNCFNVLRVLNLKDEFCRKLQVHKLCQEENLIFMYLQIGFGSKNQHFPEYILSVHFAKGKKAV